MGKGVFVNATKTGNVNSSFREKWTGNYLDFPFLLVDLVSLPVTFRSGTWFAAAYFTFNFICSQPRPQWFNVKLLSPPSNEGMSHLEYFLHLPPSSHGPLGSIFLVEPNSLSFHTKRWTGTWTGPRFKFIHFQSRTLSCLFRFSSSHLPCRSIYTSS